MFAFKNEIFLPYDYMGIQCLNINRLTNNYSIRGFADVCMCCHTFTSPSPKMHLPHPDALCSILTSSLFFTHFSPLLFSYFSILFVVESSLLLLQETCALTGKMKYHKAPSLPCAHVPERAASAYT